MLSLIGPFLERSVVRVKAADPGLEQCCMTSLNGGEGDIDTGKYVATHSLSASFIIIHLQAKMRQKIYLPFGDLP